MMNSYYLDKKNLEIIGREFSKIKIIRLEGFIEENLYETLKREIGKNKFSHKKVPDKFSFSESKNSKLTNQILGSPELEYIVQNIIKKSVKVSGIKTKKFSHKDYAIIKDEPNKKEELEFFFFICESWNPIWGGNKALIKKEKTFVFPPGGNSFILAQKEKDAKEFTQYVNNLSTNRSFIIIEGKLNAPAISSTPS